MIYLRLAGGLGNQIFQLCAALALQHDAKEPIILGSQALKHYDSVRDLELRKFFRLPPEITNESESGAFGSLQRVLNRSRAGRWLPFAGVNDRNFRRVQLANDACLRFRYLDGYFQTCWHAPLFERARATLESLLVQHPTQKEAADCAVHIRGGDFLLTSHAKIADADFYRRALLLLAQRMSLGSIDVVTDDLVHASRLVGHIKVSLPDVQFNLPTERTNMAQDFERLRCARSRVIGNSTFSWWAAALDSKRAFTVSPTHWLPEVKKDSLLSWELALSPNVSSTARPLIEENSDELELR